MFFSRGKNAVQDPYTFVDMYKSYISNIPKTSPYYVTYAEYVDICSMFYKAISKAIIDEGIKFKLPYALGEVFIIKKKTKLNNKMPIDWKSSVKFGKKIFNLNEHTGGFGYTFFWTKPYRVKNKFVYRLVFTRTNKRYLAKAIKENKKDYFER